MSVLRDALESVISPERSLRRAPFRPTHRPRAQCVVEVLGPAGAGKTTVIRALQERHVALRNQLLVPWSDKLLVLGSIAMELLPAHFRECPGSRWFNLEELRRMVYVKGWHRALALQRTAIGTITVLDHGPICMLGLVQEFGPEIVSSRRFARWSDAAIAAWSADLDVVVWLDAPDTTLVQRIELRANHHIVKGRPFREACVFLDRCRLSFEQILSELTVRGHLKVLRFDTSNVSTAEVVEQLLKTLGPPN
jgi:hypothetical protein